METESWVAGSFGASVVGYPIRDTLKGSDFQREGALKLSPTEKGGTKGNNHL